MLSSGMSEEKAIGGRTQYELFHGDCLEIMTRLEPGSVDAIICDPPYG